MALCVGVTLSLLPGLMVPAVAGIVADNPVYQHYDLQIFARYGYDQISYETLVRLWLGTPPSQEAAEHYADLGAFSLYTLSRPPGGTQPLSAGSLRAKALSGPSAATVTGTYTLSSSTPSLPFLGERTLVLDADLFDNNTNVSAVGLRRQGDCTLVEDVLEPVNNELTFTSYVELTGAQDYLHTQAGLTTTPDVYPNGCTESGLGKTKPYLVATVGVTGNGIAEIADINSSSNALEVQEVNSATNSTSTVTLASTFSSWFVADVNNDGQNDIVLGGVTDPATSHPAVAVYLNNNDGTFKAPTYVDTNAALLTIDDVTGDGAPDLVASLPQTDGSGNVTGGTLETFPGKGDGTFGTAVASAAAATSSFGTFLGAGDVNGDGKPDLVFSNYVWFGVGNGTFIVAAAAALPVLPYSDGLGTIGNGAAVGDVNHDGKADIVYFTSFGSNLQVLIGNGDGTFKLGASYASLAPAGQQVEITDIDGDGNPDIVVGNSSQGLYFSDSNDPLGGVLQILLGRGDGTFVGARSYFSGSYDYVAAAGTYSSAPQIAAGDFNGDGKPDILVYDVNSNEGLPSSLALLPGDGAGNLGAAVTSAVNLAPSMIVAADMNKDGKLDAVLAGAPVSGSTSVVSVLTNQGNGTFAGEQDYVLPGLVLSLTVGDFNGDGLPDVAVGIGFSGAANGVYVLLGQTNGTLATPVKIDASTKPLSIAAGDLNGDGRADLVIADEGVFTIGSTTTSPGALHVYLGQSNGTFTAAALPATNASNYSAVALGDLNGDGKLDLVAAGFGTAPSIYTLVGNGDGTFQTAKSLALAGSDGLGVQSLALADFNQDGHLDVAAGNPNDYTEVLFGTGDGTLIDSLIALGQQPEAIVAPDLNGDKYPELVIGQLGSNGSLAVFTNLAQWTVSSSTTAATTTTLSASPNPATAGATVTLTATVTSTTAGTPSGNITFLDGTTTLGTTALASGTATLSTSGIGTGSHSLTAVYGGDATYAASTSAAVALTVNAAAALPTVTISVDPTSVVAGSSATLTWSSTNAIACSAGGSWSGTQATSGSLSVTPATSGSYSYTLTCTGSGGTATATAVLSATLVAVTVSAKSGGGALTWPLLLALGLLVALRLRPPKWIARRVSLGIVVVLMIAGNSSARADEGSDPWYVGIRVGSMPVRLDSGNVDRGLVALGYADVTATTETSGTAGTVFLGYAFTPRAGVEFSYTYRDANAAQLHGNIAALANLTPLLRDTTELLRSYGNILALAYSAHLEVAPRFMLEPRLGGFFWATKETAVGFDDRIDATHEGGGITAGLTAAYRLWRGLEFGVSVDHYRGFPNNIATLYGGTLEWRF